MRKLSKHYRVEYRMYECGDLHHTYVGAANKYEAYDKAVYEIIPDMEGRCPYSAWVVNVTYSNGNIHVFNSTEGNRFGE